MSVTTSGNFAMFTDEGNRLVAKMVDEILALPLATTDRDVYATLQERMDALEKAGHGEVWDTAVRECVIGRIERVTKRDMTIYF